MKNFNLKDMKIRSILDFQFFYSKYLQFNYIFDYFFPWIINFFVEKKDNYHPS
jgi:hypothetical protein